MLAIASGAGRRVRRAVRARARAVGAARHRDAGRPPRARRRPRRPARRSIVPLELVLGKPPRMTRRAETDRARRARRSISAARRSPRRSTACSACRRSPTSRSSSRSAIAPSAGWSSRDPMVGRFQVPVADCALTTAGFDTYAGEVMAIGERPPVALLDAAAASRLAIAEAITNLAAAPIGALVADQAVVQLDGRRRPPRRGRAPLRRACAPRARPRSRARHRDPRRQGLDVDAHAVGRQGGAGRSRRSRSSSPRSGRATTSARAVTPELQGGDRQLLLVDLGAARAGSARAASRRCSASSATRRRTSTIRTRLLALLRRDPGARRRRQARRVPRPLRRRPDRHARSRWRSPSGLGLELDVSTVHADPFAGAVRRGARRDRRGRAADVAHVRARARRPRTVHAIGRAVARRSGPRHPPRHAPARRARAPSCARAGRTSPTRSRAAATMPTCADEEHAARLDPASARPHRRSSRSTPPPTSPRRSSRRRAPARRDPARAGRQRSDRDGRRVHARRLRGRRRPHDRSDRGPRRPRRLPRRGRVRRLLVRRRARRRARLGGDVPLQRARSATRSRKFVDRADTFVLGVCNGCQMVADLAPDLVPALRAGRASCSNRSERFEARVVMLADRGRARRSSSGAWPARGSRSRTRTARAAPSSPPARSPRSRRSASSPRASSTAAAPSRPALPGEPERLAGGDRRGHHARRPRHRSSCRTPSACSAPCSSRGTRAEWGEDSPWMRMFRNARVWVG